MTASQSYSTKARDYLNRPFLVFLLYWVVVFILYLPTAMAGRVGDFPGWVHFLNSVKFTDYINRSDSGIRSMYQFTQIVSYGFYKLFGANAWLWHLLFVSMQAMNALLLFLFFRRLFANSSVKNGLLIALCGALLFCVCPHISEVVVWESAFHYLLALMLMMIVLYCTQNYILTRKIKYAWWAGVVFFLSNYSLEVFYLTPVFVFTLSFYYRIALNADKGVFKKVLLYLVLPEVVCFAIYLLLLKAIYHEGVAHITGASVQVNVMNLSKGLKYIFHILFFGRFFSADTRQKVYHLCESVKVLAVFYGLIAVIFVFIAIRFRQMKTNWKNLVLLFIWVLCALALIMPLWFPDTGLVIYDRYTYVLDAFVYMFLVLLLGNIFGKNVFMIVVLLFALVNIRFTHRVNAYWQQSARIVNNLVSTFPNDTTKKVLLLDLPECLDGVQMVGTRDDGEFRMMYNAIMPDKINNAVYDVEAFYMRSPNDGAHVMVVDDTTIRVTLNQWGTYWVYYGFGATSYENSDFKVIMRDVGHWYDVILKHPASEYLLLYNAGSEWKKVDQGKKNVDQY